MSSFSCSKPAVLTPKALYALTITKFVHFEVQLQLGCGQVENFVHLHTEVGSVWVILLWKVHGFLEIEPQTYCGMWVSTWAFGFFRSGVVSRSFLFGLVYYNSISLSFGPNQKPKL